MYTMWVYICICMYIYIYRCKPGSQGSEHTQGLTRSIASITKSPVAKKAVRTADQKVWGVKGFKFEA